MLPERAYFENVRGMLHRRIGSRGLRQEYRLTDLANKPIEQYLIRKKTFWLGTHAAEPLYTRADETSPRFHLYSVLDFHDPFSDNLELACPIPWILHFSINTLARANVTHKGE